uniref:Uncharacterized protein n=1 Tax=Human herpesvirus 1 TaxID=10298 RepID=A0A2Z4H837_HHV1|nr:hypothetical protein [Human alphaherpesvirus 1]AWW10936.1 hypothetical protein [Human alphaherpesvirus 1]
MRIEFWTITLSAATGTHVETAITSPSIRALTRRPTVAEAMALGFSLRASFHRVSS